MFCAGYCASDIAAEFRRVPPIQRVRLALAGDGIMCLSPAAATLRTLLPPRFEELQRDFAVGVVSRDTGAHELIDRGDLAEAVVASAAVPVLFRPVPLRQGASAGPYIDGGVACRIGLDLWRRHRYPGVQPAPAIVHLITRSSRFSGNDDTSNLGECHGHTRLESYIIAMFHA